jgi:predicted nucleotidyltransferase
LDKLEHHLSRLLGCKVDIIAEPVRNQLFQNQIDRDRALAF